VSELSFTAKRLTYLWNLIRITTVRLVSSLDPLRRLGMAKFQAFTHNVTLEESRCQQYLSEKEIILNVEK